MDPENLESSFDIGGDDSDVDAAFAEAFRRAGEGDTETPAEVTPAAEAAAPEEQETETEPEAIEAPEESGDDDVAGFLAKYGNDPDKALKAAVELTKLQGRQGDELGQLRQEVAALRESQQRPQEQPTPSVQITADFVEELDAQALENPQAAMTRAAQADPSGQLASRVLDTWFAVNPREASAFQASLIARQQEERIRAEYEPLLQKDQQSEADNAFVTAWEAARTEVAKSGAEMNDLSTDIQAALEKNEPLAKAILSAETVAEQATLLKVAHDLVAAEKATTSAADAELQAEAARQARAEETAAKKIARVVKPSAVGSPPGAGEKTEQTEDDRIKAGILGAQSTDILSGLTTE